MRNMAAGAVQYTNDTDLVLKFQSVKFGNMSLVELQSLLEIKDKQIYQLTKELQEAKKEIEHNAKNIFSEELPTPKPFPCQYKMPKTLHLMTQSDKTESLCLSTSRLESFFVTGGADLTIKKWSSTGRKLLELPGSEKVVLSVDVSPNEQFILGSSADKVARLWSSVSGKLLHWLQGHLDSIFVGKFLNHSKVITGSGDRTLKIWDIEKSICLRTTNCFHSCSDLSTATDPDHNTYISAHSDNEIRFWDTRNSDCLWTSAGLHSKRLTSVCVSPSHTLLLTSSRDNTLKLLDLRTRAALFEFSRPTYENPANWSRACFSPDGRYVAAGSGNGCVMLWDAKTGEYEDSLLSEKSSPFVSVSWTTESLIAIDRSGFVSLWN
uniref:Uncharacterized protein n=1 Tax=Arcella intermedia TaxID=1963864 RepID=A0A6B2L6R4_9EUKA